MPSPTTTKPQRLLRFRPLHGFLLAGALLAPLVLTTWLGGAEALQRIKHFPLTLLLLMLLLAFLCWNLNATRLRLMLGGRAGQLGQRGALGIELASKFALCATPGGMEDQPLYLSCLQDAAFLPPKGQRCF